jgi:uncharacterized protein
LTPEDRDYALYRLSCADDTLSEAQALLQTGKGLRGAVNRIYYACFYAVSALLATSEMSASKHSGVRALFNQHWIKVGALEPYLGAFYGAMFDRRQTGDYEPYTEFERADVEEWLTEARAFVAQVTEWLRQNVPGMASAPEA